MKTISMKGIFAIALAAGLGLVSMGAAALDTVGARCSGTACRAADGVTVGGTCIGHYCVAGSGGTSGGECIGDFCQAGNGGTGGGRCFGTGCKAGAGGTGGGSCEGNRCQAGEGGSGGGHCAGADCKPGNRGRVTQVVYLPENLPCCMAWHQLGLLDERDFFRACSWKQTVNMSADKCQYWDRDGQWKTAEPLNAVAPAKMPDPPTSVEPIREQTRIPPDPRCPFKCQVWNSAGNVCVGPRENECDR